MSSMNKKIGYFGGSFNPPHNGHIQIIEYLIKISLLDNIIIAPSYYVKHKNYDSRNNFSFRYEMTKLSIDNNKLLNSLLNNGFITLSKIEEECYKNNQNYTYTYDVLNYLKIKDESSNINNKYYIIIGYDSIQNIALWYNYEYLLKDFTFIIFDRKISDNKIYDKTLLLEDLKKKYSLDYLFLNDLSIVDISSTYIRNQFNDYYKTNNKEILSELMKYLNIEVINYILNNHLYKE